MNRFIKRTMILALALAMSLGAWAQQERLLTTVNASSGFTNGTQTFDNIVTVTLNGVAYSANYGWYCPGSPGPVEVAPVNGVTVTGYMLYFSATDPIEFEGSSFEVALEGNRVLADDIYTQLGSVGITKIEVYGYAADPSPTVTFNAADSSWGFTMPGYNAALNVTYYGQPGLAYLYDGQPMPAQGITAYYGFHQETMQKISFSMGNDFLTYITGLSSAEQTALFSLLVDSSSNPAVVAIGLQGLEVVGPGECDIYSIFRGNDDFLADTAAFHLTILDPDTLTLSANGNGTVSPLLGGDAVWNNQTWSNWSDQSSSSEHTVGDITVTATNDYIFKSTRSGEPLFISNTNGGVTFTSAGAPFTRIEMTCSLTQLFGDHAGWSFDGSTAVWEGNAASVTFAICTTYVDQITFTTGSTDIVALNEAQDTLLVIPGAEVQVVATAKEGNYLQSWTPDSTVRNILSDTLSFIMPEADANFTATFAQNPLLTLAPSGQGSVSLDGVTAGTAETLLTTINASNSFRNGSQTFDNKVTATFSAQVGKHSTKGWYPQGNSASTLTVAAANDDYTVTRVKFYTEQGDVFDEVAPFEAVLVSEEVQSIGTNRYHVKVNGNTVGDETQPNYLNKIEVYGTAPVYPDGIAATETDNTYRVLPGTTVNVTATPAEGSYLAQWSDQTEPVEGDARLGGSHPYTMPAAPATLTATFNEIPVLTLASNNSQWGSVEMPLVAGPETLLTTINASGSFTSGSQTFDNVATVTLAGQTTYEESAWMAQYGESTSGTITLSAAEGVNVTRYKLYFNFSSTFTITASSATLNLYCEGSGRSVLYLDGYIGNEGITKIEVYGTVSTIPADVEQLTATTYRVLPGTELSVTATPDEAHYFVNWDEETALNSNTAVEKTLTMGTADIELTANFEAKPVLTLAQNESQWGTVSVNGPVVWNNQVWGSWDYFNTTFPQTIGDITINKNNFYCYYSSGKLLLDRSANSNNPNVTFTSAGDNFTRIEMTYTGGTNLEPANEWTCANGVAVWEGNAQSVTITNANDFYITQIKFIRGSGIEQLTAGTYRVDYGAEVTVNAEATALHHVSGWQDQNGTELTGATYSDYFVTTPQNLFPAKSAVTLTVTGDTTARALFGINSYDVTATVATDNREEVGTGLPMGTVGATYMAQDGTPDQSVSPAANISYTAQGGSPSTLTATANYGYVFSGWQVGTETYNTATLTLTESATVTALFVPDTFTVSATPSIAGSATLSGTGRVAYRESTTLAATPETGYHFTEWQNLAGTQLGTEATLTVQALGDSSLVAVMDTNEYNVTYTVQTDDREVIGTGLAMGTVVLTGRHMHFLNDSLSVVPAYGFRFTGWYVEDELVSEQDTFIFSPENDTAFVARFVPDTFTVSLIMNDEHAGDVLPHGQLPAGVTAGPNVTYRVPYLVPMTFYGASLEHNHIVNWINENEAEYVDGVTYSDYIVCDTFPTTSFLTLAVTGDTTVKINFLIDYYYVTVGLDEESTGRGTATGSGYYDHGDSVTITALPAEGYHFDGWDNGVEISPYAFVAVQDSTILVHFDTNVYSLTVVAETDTNTGLPMGTTLGDGLAKHFLYYDIEAVAEEGYHFVMWTDSVTDNPRTVTLTENTTFTAHFEMDPIVDVVINGVSADETMGTVSGSDTVDYGEEVILTATANEHYHFVQWNDGNSDNPRTVVAAHDSTLTAYFAVNQYAVVGVSADETMGTVSGSDTVDYQSVVVLTATAGDCYHFESWSDGETANPRSIVAEADTTVSALFAANVYSMNDTVTVCDSYEWNGTVYTQSGTYTHDGTTAAGCDMLETLYLTVNASTTGIETVTACDSYEWHDSIYTASTDESTYQTTNAAGCDSTVTLHLTVNAATASEESETACNYYTWHGETYTVSGDYSYTTQNAAGCDSTVTLHLTVNYGNLISIDSTVCDSIVWRGNVYTESGVYDFDLPSESGCFSIETLNLTVNYSSSAVETIFACDSYTWNGLQFDADNHTATYLTVNAAGCDSTVTLDLTVHYSNSGSDYITACDSFEWHGTVYTASVDDVFYHGQNVAGCDSTVVLVLTINRSVSDTVEMTAEDSYEWNGEVYTQSGTYTYSGTTVAGCDSTVTLLLTITHQPQPVYYTVTLVSADTTMGSVLPEEAVSVEEGSMFTATALAIFGRHFVAWERDGQVVSTDNPYSFEVTEDVELTATFGYEPVTVILSVNNANWGSTDPAPGTYTYEVGEQATVTATPNEGFHMLGWTINGNVIETNETTYTVEATPEMAGMTFSVIAMFVRDIAIDDVDGSNITVYTNGSKIVVSGAEHHDVYVYDVTGRCISRQTDAAETVVFPVAQTGVYMVKIGDLPAKKVVIAR